MTEHHDHGAAAGLELVEAFANTVDPSEDTDALPGTAELGEWLRAHALLEPGIEPDTAQHAHAVALRTALRDLMAVNAGGAPDPVAAAVLDAAAERAQLTPRFSATGGATLEAAAAGVDGALGRLLAEVELAMRDGSWIRLKLCADPTCRWAFYDGSRNRAGRWCDMAVCGNRAKSRRAYRRRRATGADQPA